MKSNKLIIQFHEILFVFFTTGLEELIGMLVKTEDLDKNCFQVMWQMFTRVMPESSLGIFLIFNTFFCNCSYSFYKFLFQTKREPVYNYLAW